MRNLTWSSLQKGDLIPCVLNFLISMLKFCIFMSFRDWEVSTFRNLYFFERVFAWRKWRSSCVMTKNSSVKVSLLWKFRKLWNYQFWPATLSFFLFKMGKRTTEDIGNNTLARTVFKLILSLGRTVTSQLNWSELVIFTIPFILSLAIFQSGNFSTTTFCFY